ncbi:hypothetical protein B0T11DRAFT_341631 [Plectosphaerella cucumerina]|uniref:Uncharacterized protein n=1 Tax=Plectosphaerella cucumerina TaxID=40658 RepID=A0A8K0TBH2_9PEZI|nr:hypothetical protein B0T11DRAFT_341631 [Plectosphaerella cucumerina]
MLPAKSLLLAALSATVSATVTLVEVVRIVDTLEITGGTVHDLLEGSSVNDNSPRALFAKRATSEECSSSISSFGASAPTGDPEVERWWETAAVTDSCSLVAPTSLSSGIFSFLTAVLDWAVEEVYVASALSSKCPDQWPTATLEPLECTTALAFYFTNSANATTTVRGRSVLADYTPPKPKDADSAASAVGVSLSALAVVGIIAVAGML